MSMPKAAVHKNNLPVPRKNYVGLSRKLLVMQAEAITHAVEKLSDNYFRPGVASRNSGHDPATPLF